MSSRADRVKHLQTLASAESARERFVDAALVLRIFDDAQMMARLNCTYDQLVDAVRKADGAVIDVHALLKKKRPDP